MQKVSAKTRREQPQLAMRVATRRQRRTLIGSALVLGLAFGVANSGCGNKAGAGAAGGASAGGGPSGAGAGGSSGMVGSVTPLNESSTLGSLSPTDSAKLCSDTYAYFGRGISQSTLCKWAGLTYGVSSSAPSDSQLEQNCASQEAACEKAGPAAASCSALPADCSATVGQYNACIADEVNALSSGVAALPACATVTLNDLAGVWTLITGDPPASCASLTNACPTLELPAPHSGTDSTAAGGSGGYSATGGSGNSGGASNGGSSTSTGGGGASGGSVGSGGAPTVDTLPGDAAKAAGTPFVAAHAMTRALFASYTGPLFKALRVSDQQEKDISSVAGTGFVDTAALDTFCAGTICKVTTLYDQSGNGNDM